MNRLRYESYVDEGTGIRFVCKHDDADPSVLHIYARYLTTPREAIETFKRGTTGQNELYRRFETVTDTHELHWFWIEEGGVVMVISCMRKESTTWTT